MHLDTNTHYTLLPLQGTAHSIFEVQSRRIYAQRHSLSPPINVSTTIYKRFGAVLEGAKYDFMPDDRQQRHR